MTTSLRNGARRLWPPYQIGDFVSDTNLSETPPQDSRQSGTAITGLAATARNVQIAAVLTTKNSPDVNLSPDVEAQARGLGRAVADKIVA